MKVKDLLLLVLMFAVLMLAGGCSYGVSNNMGNSNQTTSNSRNAGNSNQTASNSVNIKSERNDAGIATKNETTKAEPNEDDNRIKFAKGKSSATLSGAVIRGERAAHILGAKAGQTMTVKITSEEDNAVFQIENPAGKFLKKAGESDDAMTWSGPLSDSGDYKIIVGGTRGNATYKLTVSIK